jgi:hypothetical protein
MYFISLSLENQATWTGAFRVLEAVSQKSGIALPATTDARDVGEGPPFGSSHRRDILLLEAKSHF